MDYTSYWPYVYNPYQMGMAFPLIGTAISQQQCTRASVEQQARMQRQCLQADIDLMQRMADSISMANAMINAIPPAMPKKQDLQEALYNLAFPEDPIRDYFRPILQRIENEMAEIEKSYSMVGRYNT